MWVLIVLVGWIVVVAIWASRPISDTVSTGIIKNVKTGELVETYRTVQCESPLSGNTKSTALPVLHGGRSYQQAPWEMPIQQGRIIFALDIAVVLAALVILVKTWKPSPTSESSDLVAFA